MSEERAEYQAGDEDIYRCPRCYYPHGKMVVLANGQKWLKIGKQIFRSFNSVCECGEVLCWSVSDTMLAELVQTTLALRIR